MNKLTKALLVAVPLISAAVVGLWMNVDAAPIDRGRDCDKFAVIYCGTENETALKAEFASNNGSSVNGSTRVQSDIQSIFSAFGIGASDISGLVWGVVYRDGKVRLNDGTIVAKNAQVAIRNMSGGTAISGSSTARIHSASRMGSAQEAMIKLNSKGQFMFAVLTPCGNPVKATNVVPEPPAPTPPTPPAPPTPPTPPAPAPQPVATCDAISAVPNPFIGSRDITFSAKASVKNGATISSYVFTAYDSNGKQVATTTVNTNATNANGTLKMPDYGTFTVKVVVNTSAGQKTGGQCETKITIKKPENVVCKSIGVTVGADRKTVSLFGEATKTSGASIHGFVFTIVNKSTGATVFERNITTTETDVTTSAKIDSPGTYVASVKIRSNPAAQDSANCQKEFTIEAPAPAPKTPKIEIVKTVNGVENAVVEIDQPFTYEVKVKNNGEVDLVNAVVSDPAPEGVSFKSADKGTITDNKWSYTIPSLKVGEEQTFKITAVVTKQINGRVKNTACVDTPTIPGGPDGCDDAFISIKIKACNITTGVIESVEPGKENTHPYTTDLSRCEKVKVCEISTKTIVEVTRKEAEDTNRYADENSDKCKDQPVVVPPTPVAELPKTGVITDVFSALGLGALVTASAAYVLSRRTR